MSQPGGVTLSDQHRFRFRLGGATSATTVLKDRGGGKEPKVVASYPSPRSAPGVCFRGNLSVGSRKEPVRALVLTQHDQPEGQVLGRAERGDGLPDSAGAPH